MPFCLLNKRSFVTKLISVPFCIGANQSIVAAVVCIVCFFIGLIFVTGAGEYWVKIFDSFAGTTGLIFIALLESIAVMYIYGHEK